MKTADPELMRAINRFHVLDTIRRHGPIARVEISERTELSATTVSQITGLLIEEGLIAPRQVGDIRSTARGRPRVMLELNPDAARVVGVKIGAHRIVAVVTNFLGDVLASLTLPVRVERQPPGVVADLVEDAIRRCVADARLSLKEINSVCVSLPGVVEHGSGLIRYSPVLRKSPTGLRDALLARLDLPVLIESDANAVTVAEHWFRLCRDLDNFLVVTLEQSIGLGVMHEGQIYRGARGISFNLGDLVTSSPGSAAISRLADFAAEPAILASCGEDPQLIDAARLGRGLAHLMGKGGVLEAERPSYRQAAATAGRAIGLAVANLVTLFAPPRVVLVGSSLALGEDLVGSLRQALARAVPPYLSDVTELVTDDMDDSAWARGAAATALRELYGAPWGTTGPARGPAPINHQEETAPWTGSRLE
ncbi:transcriptional regulator, MarR family [Faunimonas pinastri]|uniref:Transcriptional regulator, MarR family n=1 Tax=Faunimonas pinastri TaxID=1855383 RepID=A0A1H9NIZ8_9HYPH|nr:ROK family transcriptional regulator [Faunimonas pinastri]SER35363.1 transcriptional regulator, MarR family [Faunimonas pinastri]